MQISTTENQRRKYRATDKKAEAAKDRLAELTKTGEAGIPLFLQRSAQSVFSPAVIQHQSNAEEEEGLFQPKLTVNEPHDVHEQEADWVEERLS